MCHTGWRRQHAGHHGVWNDLDRRQIGAYIYSSCLTVEEYPALSPRQRWWYRATRHPLVANLLLPPLIFILLYRLPFDMPKSWRRERRLVHLTSLALVAALRDVPACSLWDGLRALSFSLWDEGRGRMVTFREAAARGAGA